MFIIRDCSFQNIFKSIFRQPFTHIGLFLILLNVMFIHKRKWEWKKALWVSIKVWWILSIFLSEFFFLKFIHIIFLSWIKVNFNTFRNINSFRQAFSPESIFNSLNILINKIFGLMWSFSFLILMIPSIGSRFNRCFEIIFLLSLSFQFFLLSF